MTTLICICSTMSSPMANNYAKLVELYTTKFSANLAAVEIHVLDSALFSEDALQKLQEDFRGIEIKLLNIECDGNAWKYAVMTYPEFASYYFLQSIG